MLSFLRNRAVLTRLALVTLAFAAVGVLYAFLAPRWYRSLVTVVAAKQQKAGISGLLGGDLAGLASGLDPSLGGGADIQRIASVLQSITVSDAAIERFHLKERYDEDYLELTRDELWKHCGVKVLPKPGLVQLSCEDKDPHFAQELVQFLAERGNEVFHRVNLSSASEEVRFLEKRAAQLRASAEESAAKVREFQEKHGIVDLDTQSKALVTAMSTLNAQRMNKRLEFDFARTFSATDEATLQQLSSQLSVMDQSMRDLESAQAAGPAGSGRRGRPGSAIFPAALDVPKLRAEFEVLYRERKVSEATLIIALERLESARANEARDTSTFVVMDAPTLPTRHSRPKRAMAVLLATVLGAIVAFSYEWTRSVGGASRALAIATGWSNPLSRNKG